METRTRAPAAVQARTSVAKTEHRTGVPGPVVTEESQHIALTELLRPAEKKAEPFSGVIFKLSESETLIFD